MNWRYIRHFSFNCRCLRCKMEQGDAYFVWRAGPIRGTGLKVARICEAIGGPEAVSQSTPILAGCLLEEKNIIFAGLFCSNINIDEALLRRGMKPVITMPNCDLLRSLSPVANNFRKMINLAYIFPRRQYRQQRLNHYHS